MKYRLIAQPNENYSPVQQILVNRGIESKNIEKYLKTTDEVLFSPELFGECMSDGVRLLMSAIENEQPILIIVDCDADGYTSSAALINYLSKVFPKSVDLISIKIHEGKEHGIEEKWLDEIISEGYKLVICPDASSNDYEQHKILAENQIKVLVLDHHDAERISEHAVIINNQLSDYPNKTLSGVGVVYKFCKKIDEVLNINDADYLLDLVSLGMIADMMDMRSFETKHLIQKGLTNIQNPFFKGLVERQSYSLGGHVTPIGIAFYIAPLINATIRVGTQQEKEIMFKAMLPSFAYEKIPSTKRGCKGQEETIIEQAVRNSTNIRNRQKKYRDEGLEFAENIILRDALNTHKLLVIQVDNTLDKNLTGLIANQLMAKYQKPVIIVRETEEGVLQGSARGYDKSELRDLKEYLLSTKLMNYAEGHANAMGVGFSKSDLPNLVSKADLDLEKIDFSASYDVDYIYLNNEFKPQHIIDIGGMKSLWGKGVEEALIAIQGIKVTKNNLTLMSPDRNPTIKIVLPNGVSVIKFGSSKEEYESLLSEGYVEIDVVGTAAINEWMGNITAQILIKDFEIKSQQKYYF